MNVKVVLPFYCEERLLAKGEVIDLDDDKANEGIRQGFLVEMVDVTKEIDWEKAKAETIDAEFKAEIIMLIATKKRREATEEIVKLIEQQEHIHTTRDDEKSEMWIYKEGIYIPEGKTFVKEICRDIFGEAYTVSIGNEVIAKIETDTYITQEDLFTNENIDEIAVENGILNIFTNELGIFTPKKKFFNKLPITFNPDAECLAIQKHFEEVLKYKEDTVVMEEIFGFLLLREYRFEKAFMFIGTGRNGKSKTLELMKRFLGLENCASIPLQQLEQDNFAMGELFRKMANVSGDLDNKALNHTGAFKTLTGRDLISASRKFLNRVKFTNYAKMIFACNELPETKDLSHAFFSRWIVLEFPYTFMDKKEYEESEDKNKLKIKDEKIIDKISTDEELSGLLNLALTGFGRLAENGTFSYSKNTEEVKKLWMRKSSSFQAYIMDELEYAWGQFVVKGSLKENYVKYCTEHKLKIETDKLIAQTITTTLGAYSARKTINDMLEHIWMGIRFKSNEL